MGMLSIDFINVGYGDAILIREQTVPFTMLVDCGDIAVGDGGSGSQRISAADYLRQEHIDTLDLLVLTHLHRDHSGGLKELLKTVSVREFWTNYLPDSSTWKRKISDGAGFSAGARCLLESMSIYLSALQTMHASGTVMRCKEHNGETVWLTPLLRAELHLEEASLYERQKTIWQDVLEGRPDGRELDQLDAFINNTSIRMRLLYGEKTIELPGDIYAACWEKHSLSPCSLVKLPHHGHRDSITPKLLDMLQPEDVVISVSNTRTDNCPAASVIQEIARRGLRIHITDAVSLLDSSPVYHNAVHFEFQTSSIN